MPTISRRSSAGTSLLCVALLIVAGCGKKEQPAAQAPTTQPAPQAPKPVVTSKPRNNFEAITSQLDSGGDLYAYVSTEQVLKEFAGEAGKLREVLLGIPGMEEQGREHIAGVFTMVTNLSRQSGIEDLRGLGMSSIPLDNGIHRTKLFLYHGEKANPGFLWNVWGAKEHSLDLIEMLPATTALASVSDLDLSLVWSVVQKHLADSGLPEAQKILTELPSAFEQATGLKLDAVLNSLGGTYGLVLTLDPERTVSVPVGQDTLDIPEPALMLMAKVKDDTLFKRIDKALKDSGQSVIDSNRPGFQMRTLPVPLPLPMQLAITVAQSEGYLFLASTDTIVTKALAAKADKKGLGTTEEFKRLARDIPRNGNQFTFMGERFGQTVRKLQRQALRMAESMGSEQQNLLRSLIQDQPPAVLFAVGSHTSDGWLYVANGNQHPAKVLLSAAIIPAAAAAGVAIPQMVKAKQHEHEMSEDEKESKDDDAAAANDDDEEDQPAPPEEPEEKQ